MAPRLDHDSRRTRRLASKCARPALRRTATGMSPLPVSLAASRRRACAGEQAARDFFAKSVSFRMQRRFPKIADLRRARVCRARRSRLGNR